MIFVHNSFNRKKEIFEPLVPDTVGIYVCGPTVYDLGHLGHGRAAVSFDVIRRYFIWKKFKVRFVSNVTDIDDKMIQRAAEQHISVQELADRITPEYEKDFSVLRVLPPDFRPKATEYVEPMIALIQKMEQRNCIYTLADGVYFDVSRFPDYGKLSGQNLSELEMGARVAVHEGKKNPQDFVLWKFEKPGEPAWDSPWGRGRPGWHLECSAMSWKLLGETFDIHGGGADLMFPHHECEIAQSEIAHQKPFVRYFLHNGFININEEKMSKSLGNFVTLRDIFSRYSGRAVRFFYLQTHYRSPINFEENLLVQAVNALERFDAFLRRLDAYPAPDGKSVFSEFLQSARKKFEESMDDDFETPGALAAIFEMVKEGNRFLNDSSLTQQDVDNIRVFLDDVDHVLAFMPEDSVLAEDIQKLIQWREDARIKKDFGASDRIRKELADRGIELEDTPHGTVWKVVKK